MLRWGGSDRLAKEASEQQRARACMRPNPFGKPFDRLRANGLGRACQICLEASYSSSMSRQLAPTRASTTTGTRSG